MKCRNCGKTQHYCSSCSPEPCLDHNCCSDTCMREYYNWSEFLAFYYRLLNFAAKDEEKKLVENIKYDLWNEWCWNHEK